MPKLREEPHPVEPMPDWFLEAICTTDTPALKEAVRTVSRSARHYAYLLENVMEAYARLRASDSAISLGTNEAHAMASLLWAALAALEAAQVVVTEKASALA